jgi:hypothetical protein
MPFIQGTAAGKVALSPFLNFRAEHYCVWGVNRSFVLVFFVQTDRFGSVRFLFFIAWSYGWLVEGLYMDDQFKHGLALTYFRPFVA